MVTFYSTETCVSNCRSLSQTSLLNSSPMQGKSPPSQNIQMKWASRLTQLAMFSNLRNDCRRCKEEGQYRREQAGRGSLVKWVGTSVALCNHGTCRCRCSSSKSFYQPSEREVTSNSFGITHTPPPCVSKEEFARLVECVKEAGSQGQQSWRGWDQG